MKYDFHNKKFIELDKSPNKLSIAGSDRDIDWNALKEKVELFSKELKKLNIPTGHPVLIFGHKEHTFPVSILSCIHSSIAYIPIDKIYPKDRIKRIIEISGTQILINLSDEVLDFQFAICINSALEIKINHPPDFENRIYGTNDDPLQYIMFTSGSTGEPKGVQITRQSSLTFTDWLISDYGYGDDEVIINQAPFSFDLSLYDLMTTFSIGASLVLNSIEIFSNPELFLKRIFDYRCTVWISTPSFAFLFLRNSNFNTDEFQCLNTFLFIGETLPNRTAKILKSRFPKARIFNAYGPTEATVATSLIELTSDMIEKYPSLPIGYPMPGSELLIDKIYDDDKDGELIIVGNHVSIGYLKNDDLNTKKFFIHKGKRAFRTGDLAYYEDGILFFIGRNDEQIKMHGFRIELNEISNVICKNPNISDAITVPLKRNNEVKKIVSFVIVKTKISQTELLKDLMASLKKTLPYYMIPGDISIVPDFPYSTSHKIDKIILIEEYILKQNR